jgi:hypothetical protein
LLAGLLASALLNAPTDQPTIQITGPIKHLLALSAADLARMPLATVRTTSKQAGVPQGSDLRGKALTTYVIAEAQDNYQVLFSLAELDSAFIDNEILPADTANGKPLFGAQGRFRLVVPKNKPGARSLRMLTRIEV